MALGMPPTATQIGIHKGVHHNGKMAGVGVFDKIIDLLVYLVGEANAGLYLACAAAGGAGFQHLDLRLRTKPLTGNLYQTELGGRQNRVFGRVVFHGLDHGVEQEFAVGRVALVYKIHNDNPTQIAQPYLARHLLGGIQINLQGVALLALVGRHAMAAVHVYHVHGLGVFHHQIGSVVAQIHHLAEKRFYLLGYAKVVEDGLFAFV